MASRTYHERRQHEQAAKKDRAQFDRALQFGRLDPRGLGHLDIRDRRLGKRLSYIQCPGLAPRKVRARSR